MAILPSVPYVRVCINTSTGNLKEHPDPDGPPRELGLPGQPHQNKMSVYVEAKSDANFRFEYYVVQKRMPKNTCLGFFAIIDGHKTSSVTICNEDGFKPNQWNYFLRGDRIRKPSGKMTMRGFEFAEIKTVDSGAPPTAQNDVSKLGELVVQIWRIRRGEKIPAPTEQPPGPKDNIEYHEKELRGRDVSHATKHNRFRKEKTAKGTETFFQLDYIDPVDTPLVEFHFKYRSRGDPPVLRGQPDPPRRLPSPIIDVQLHQVSKEKVSSPSTTREPPKADKLLAIIATSRAASATLLAKPNPNKIPIQPRIPPKPLSDFLPAQPQIPAATTASPAILKAVTNAPPKGAPATPVETRTEATYRPDAMTPASTGLKAASEGSGTPFTRVMTEINKNLGHLRNIARGTAAGSEVYTSVVRTVISHVEEQIRREANPQAGLSENSPGKRERAQDSDDDLQVVLERPVKRRHVFTDEDHIIDLTDS
ncbi:hypothetical protein CJF31_00003489 [Rutstroemia sp. NJR-2017a BVV2]|nr:hypothetical protein CJF31_00003489 [Rutstroemia sp. NJR-2017a BVV2]